MSLIRGTERMMRFMCMHGERLRSCSKAARRELVAQRGRPAAMMNVLFFFGLLLLSEEGVSVVVVVPLVDAIVACLF